MGHNRGKRSEYLIVPQCQEVTSFTFLTSAVEADEARRRITRFRLAAGVAQLASADQAAGAVCPGRLRAVRAVRGLANIAGSREGAFARRHRAVARASGLRGRKPRLQKEQNEDEAGSTEQPTGSAAKAKSGHSNNLSNGLCPGQFRKQSRRCFV